MQHKKGKFCFYITLVETSMHGINPLKPSGNYVNRVLYESVTLHLSMDIVRVNRDHFLKQH
jgi:hypothetical protein